MDRKLLSEVIKREKTVTGVKAFMVLPVAALHFAVVAWCVGTDELVADTQLSSGGFKESRQVSAAVGKTIGKFKAIVSLDALHTDASACIPLNQPFQEIGRRKGGLLWVGSQEAQTGELVNSGVLV